MYHEEKEWGLEFLSSSELGLSSCSNLAQLGVVYNKRSTAGLFKQIAFYITASSHVKYATDIV